MKDFINFIKSKIFFKHSAIAITALALILFVLFKTLFIYTNHGETTKVPDFTGKEMNELDAFVSGKNIRWEIIDSIYSPKEKGGIVIKQDPLPKVEVKHNRKIYLYVTSKQAPQIEMPILIDLSLRQAIATIKSYELTLDPNIKKVAGECNGCVLEQVVNGQVQKIKDENNKKIAIMVKKGTLVQLVIGEGESNQRILVPNLIGLTLDYAIQKLSNDGLTIGVALPDDGAKDMTQMFVYKQTPVSNEEAMVRIGSAIDLYLTNDKSKIEK